MVTTKILEVAMIFIKNANNKKIESVYISDLSTHVPSKILKINNIVNLISKTEFLEKRKLLLFGYILVHFMHKSFTVVKLKV